MGAEEHINIRSLAERLEGNHDLFRELAEMFIANSQALVSTLERAVAEGNGALIGKAAHTIKGAVANFSADRAFAAAYELEMMGKKNELAMVPAAVERLICAIDSMTVALEELIKKQGF